MVYNVEHNETLTLGELFKRLKPGASIIVEFPNGATRTINRYSYLDKDAELPVIEHYLYDEMSKTFYVRVGQMDPTTAIGLHSTETGFHWDISDCLSYLENDRKLIDQLFNKIYSPNHIDRIISRPPATIIFWGNGEKTVVKTEPDDEYDLEKGILYAILKHVNTKKDYDHYLRTIDEACDDSPVVEKKHPSDQKCPYCGANWNMTIQRSKCLQKHGYISIACGKCDGVFTVKFEDDKYICRPFCKGGNK